MELLTEEIVREMLEDELRAKVIAPLLRKMGYRDVVEWHGGMNELGKDLVCWKEEAAGNRVNTAIVAKATRISGPTVYSEVARQVRQAFNTEYDDPTSGEARNIHWVWVITNKLMTKDNREQLRSEIDSDMRRYLMLTDGNDLWERVRELLPIAPFPALNEAQQRLKQIDLGFDAQVVLGAVNRPFARIRTEDREVIIGERYQGQLEQEPVTLRGRFQFPDTPEGHAMLQEYEKAMDTGSPVEIPAEYAQIEDAGWFNGIARQLLGIDPDQPTSVQLSSGISGQRLPLRIEFAPDDGDQVDPLYADLMVTQSGRIETTMTNEHQPLPILVTLVINFRDNTVSVSFRRKDCPIAAPIMWHLLKLQECLKKPGSVRLTSLETGLSMGRMKIEAPDPPLDHSNAMELLAELTGIQEHLSQPVLIPLEPWSLEDRAAVELLRAISRHPEIEGTWENGTISFCARDIDNTLTDLSGGEKTIRIVRQKSVELSGQEISLGQVEEIAYSIKVANEADVRVQAASAANETDEIVVRLEPGSNNRTLTRYLDWIVDSSEGFAEK